MMVKKKPSFEFEKEYWKSGISTVIGLDEVGRGAFAGPIVAAGVIYKPNFTHKLLDLVNDSKLVKPKLREELSIFIKENSTWVIESVGMDYINENGIGKANIKVFTNIIDRLKPIDNNFFILADGRFPQSKTQKGIIKGDRLSLSIASASIIAKVFRDNLMVENSGHYPLYKFDQNKGYGTAFHRNAIKQNGLCDYHRKSFRIN